MTFNPGISPFRLRIQIADVGEDQSGEFKLYVKKNSGSYAPITASSTGGVQSYDASSDADDTPIRIPRLSLPSLGVHPGNDLLLRDGSFLLLRDGSSSLQLGH